jgi:hypothetical protein
LLRSRKETKRYLLGYHALARARKEAKVKVGSKRSRLRLFFYNIFF